MEPQKPSNSPGSGPEVVKRERESPKSERRKESISSKNKSNAETNFKLRGATKIKQLLLKCKNVTIYR